MSRSWVRSQPQAGGGWRGPGPCGCRGLCCFSVLQVSRAGWGLGKSALAGPAGRGVVMGRGRNKNISRKGCGVPLKPLGHPNSSLG